MKVLDKVRSALARAGVSKSGRAWYRGESTSCWPLLPKLLRHKHSRHYLCRAENELLAAFVGDAPRYIDMRSSRDSWDTLAAMQHYGVSTRLLDWTTELEIALYFAVGGTRKVSLSAPEEWPSIWVLNPFRLNKLYCGKDVIFDRKDKVPYDYYDQTVAAIRDERPWPHYLPISIDPGFSNERMQAQHARFTVHGESLEPLDALTQKRDDFWGLVRVVIDPADMGELRRHECTGAAAHHRVYPDMEGYVRFLNHRAKVL